MTLKSCRARTWFALLQAMLMTTLACSSGGPDVVPVSGFVTRNGKPVPFVTVYFQPTSGRPSLGD